MTEVPPSISYVCDLRYPPYAEILAQDVAAYTGIDRAALDATGDPTGFTLAQQLIRRTNDSGDHRKQLVRGHCGCSSSDRLPVMIVLGLSSPALMGHWGAAQPKRTRTLTPARGQAGYTHGARHRHDTRRVEVGCLWLLREIAAGRM